jgi:Ca2+-binding EF-hand superfamily protein
LYEVLLLFYFGIYLLVFKNKDGLISKDELKETCALTGFPVANDLLELIYKEYDDDKDGAINFLEFSNFLCYKDSMKVGLDKSASGFYDLILFY